MVGLVFLRVFWIFWVWVCWSSCGGWVGVPSGVLAWVCSPISAWCWSRGCGCGVADLEVFVAWVTDRWQPGVVVCADLGGLRREARNEEREKKSLNKIIKILF